jgi:hypothetical protein
MKTLLTYQGIGIVVEVPIQAKMDDDDKDLTDFQFGSSQESEIDPPLFLEFPNQAQKTSVSQGLY